MYVCSIMIDIYLLLFLVKGEDVLIELRQHDDYISGIKFFLVIPVVQFILAL